MSVSDYEESPAEVVLAINNINNNSVRKRQRQTDRQTETDREIQREAFVPWELRL